MRNFPISIDVDWLKSRAQSVAVKEYDDMFKEMIGSQKMILRVDRLEPSKNIIRGFQAFDELLEYHPEHVGKVQFLAIIAPSRMDVIEYKTYLDDIMAVVGQINANYGTGAWEPIRLLVGEDYNRAISALKHYDVLLVNSIADGMNLVAKEGSLVNEKDGVLILSDRTGASQQLRDGAKIISPCDVYETAEALHQALTMPEAEKKEHADFLQIPSIRKIFTNGSVISSKRLPIWTFKEGPMTKQKKIAILHYSAPPVIGGVKSVMEAQAKLLIRHNYAVMVLAGRGDAAALPAGVSLYLDPTDQFAASGNHGHKSTAGKRGIAC